MVQDRKHTADIIKQRRDNKQNASRANRAHAHILIKQRVAQSDQNNLKHRHADINTDTSLHNEPERGSKLKDPKVPTARRDQRKNKTYKRNRKREPDKANKYSIHINTYESVLKDKNNKEEK